MCGIIGYFNPSPENQDNNTLAKGKVTPLLINSLGRGADATGLGFINNQKNEIICYKEPLASDKFVFTKTYREIIASYNPSILIGHARTKTLGTEQDNNNNHPLTTESGLMMVHNGMLTNEDAIFEAFKLKRDGEVDSEVIIKLIEHFLKNKKNNTIKAIQKAREQIFGSMAIALLNIKEPTTLYLVASGNPVILAYHKPTGIIYFASELEILQNSLYTVNAILNFFYEVKDKDDFLYKELADNTGVKITKEGLSCFEVERKPYIYDDNTIYNSQYSQNYQEINWKSKKKAKKKYKSCSIYKPIKKPKFYDKKSLMARLKYLNSLKKITNKYQFERRRIINTLFDRLKKKEKEAGNNQSVDDCKQLAIID